MTARKTLPRPRLDLAPADPEAEGITIAALVINGEAIGQVRGFLRPEDFTRPAYRRIYEAMLATTARGMALDFVTLKAELGADAHLADDLLEIMARVPSALHVPHYAEIVRRRATERELIGAAADVARMAYDGDAPDPVSRAREILARLDGDMADSETGDVADALADLCSPRPAGWTTGIGVLDSWLGDVGLVPGRSLTISGKTGTGKTLLATALEVAALKAGARVVDFSLEMSRAERIARMAGPLVGPHASRLLRPPHTWTEADHDTFRAVVAAIEGLPGKLRIYHRVTTADRIEYLTRLHGADVILVDWYQQIEFSRQAGETSDDVDKALSWRLAYRLPQLADCCVIIVSQQNKTGGAKYGAWLESFSHAHLTISEDPDSVTRVVVEPVKNRWGVNSAAGASATFETHKAAGQFRHVC